MFKQVVHRVKLFLQTKAVTDQQDTSEVYGISYKLLTSTTQTESDAENLPFQSKTRLSFNKIRDFGQASKKVISAL